MAKHESGKAGRWELAFVPERNGHAYFFDFKSSAKKGKKSWIAVTDQPACIPEETDDDILYLDRERPIIEVDSWKGIEYHIPLITADGLETMTVASTTEAFLVAKRFKMVLQMG
jgi:hypothetical protein